MRNVVVTGIGAVTPLAVGYKKSWASLLNGHCGIVSLNKHRLDFDKVPSRVAGLVPEGAKADGRWNADEWLSQEDCRRMAQFTQYAVAACDEAFAELGPLFETYSKPERLGVCVGSGIGAFEDVYDTSVKYSLSGYKKVSPLFVPRLLTNLAAGHIAMRYKLQGPNTSPTTACTTGAHAIIEAARLIATDEADVMIAGAAESCIHPLAVAGFARARSLSTNFNQLPLQSSRPFDSLRDGFVIGEGAGVLVLEEETSARARGAQIHARIVGWGMSCDAHHMTAPPASGLGALRAMQQALARAQNLVDLGNRSIYINAHATGTALGDAAEARAIKELLSQTGINGVLSSTKGATGHLLGAAGAVEAIFTLLAVRDSIVPPNLNLEQVGNVRKEASMPHDPNVHVHEGDGADDDVFIDDSPHADWTQLDIVGKSTGPGTRAGAAVARQVPDLGLGLSNSFGFGGTNACLAFARAE